MLRFMGFHVPYYEEDENGTAIGPCTGAPVNLTEYAEACIDNCPMTPRASLSDWTSRIAYDPLVLSSLVSGAISSASLACSYIVSRMHPCSHPTTVERQQIPVLCKASLQSCDVQIQVEL